MEELIVPKKGDQILVSLINKTEVLGVVEFISDEFIVIKPNTKTCLCVVNLNNICYYYLSNNKIYNYISGDIKAEVMNEKNDIYHDVDLSVKDVDFKARLTTLKELRESQREIEIENMKAKMSTFEPSFTQTSYGVITKV
jgi:hypothetical protein